MVVVSVLESARPIFPGSEKQVCSSCRLSSSVVLVDIRSESLKSQNVTN